MEFRQSSLRTCETCSIETFNEEASGGVVLSVHLPNSDEFPPSLSKHRGMVKLNMQDIIDQYFTSGEVEAYCSHCKKHTLHQMQPGLPDPPEYLVIQAKLFYHENGSSKKKRVSIEPADLSRLAAGTTGMTSAGILYRIYAVVAHVGDSREQGHYLTIACGSGCSARIPTCGSQSGCWWLFDDNDVSGPMSKDDALEMLIKTNVCFYLYYGRANHEVQTHMIVFTGNSLHFLLCQMCHRHSWLQPFSTVLCAMRVMG
jgi:hypothetical protein